MKLFHLSSGPLKVNSYFLVNKNNEAVLIDGGENYKLIKKTEKELGVKIIALLLTHAHFDHSGNAKKLQDDGVKVYISELDAPKLLNKMNLSIAFGRPFDYLKADKTFKDNDELVFGDITIKVVATPGHTDGSVTFIVDDNMFTGDTLFHLSIGRSDFPSGDKETLIDSIKKLFAFSGDYSVYPGHDEFTTLQYERDNNGFVDYD